MILYFLFVSLLLLPISGFAYAEHIFNPEAFAQYLDISQLESEKVTFTFDGVSYNVYYGYHENLDAMGSEYLYPTLSSMKINEERKSLEIVMEDVPEKTDFWVRVPEDVIYADNEKFTVLVDGEETGYDLMNFPNDYVVGFIISENTKNIGIIGPRVIPEFGTFTILILGVAVLGLVYFSRKYSIAKNWTRIN